MTATCFCCIPLRNGVATLAVLSLFSSMGLSQVCWLGGSLGIFFSILGINGACNSNRRHLLMFFGWTMLMTLMKIWKMSQEYSEIDHAELCRTILAPGPNAEVIASPEQMEAAELRCMRAIRPSFVLGMFMSSMVMAYFLSAIWRLCVQLKNTTVVLEEVPPPEMIATTVVIEDLPAEVTYTKVYGNTAEQVQADEEYARKVAAGYVV